MKKLLIILCALCFLSANILAETTQEDQYVRELNYRRNKLEVLVKKRFVSELSGYSSTDFTATTYTLEAYSQTWGYGSTATTSRAETKEISDWIIVKGGIRELSDAEFLDITGRHEEAAKIHAQEDSRGRFRVAGTLISIAGVGYMLVASGQNQPSSSITAGGIVTAIGFIFSAFNAPQRHYLTPDYAQEEIDNYNISLKKKLDLPLDFN